MSNIKSQSMHIRAIRLTRATGTHSEMSFAWCIHVLSVHTRCRQGMDFCTIPGHWLYFVHVLCQYNTRALTLLCTRTMSASAWTSVLRALTFEQLYWITEFTKSVDLSMLIFSSNYFVLIFFCF